jgi:hypothetical protein
MLSSVQGKNGEQGSFAKNIFKQGYDRLILITDEYHFE